MAAQALEATRPASHPLAQRLASGLPKRKRVTEKVVASAAEAESRVLIAVPGNAAERRVQPEDCAGGIPGEPSHQRQQAAEEHIDGVVAGHGGGEAFFGKFAAARSGDPDHGEGAQAAERMHGGCAAGVKKACAEREVCAQSSKPSAGPNPMRGERKNDGGQNLRQRASGGKPPAIRSGAPRQQRGHGDGKKLKEQRELGLRRGRTEAVKKKGAEAEHAPGLSGHMENNFCGVPRVPANEAPTKAKTMAATATMARLPSSACAAERERPRPVLMSATPAMARGASKSSPSVSAKTASVMAGIGVATGRNHGRDRIHGRLAPRASMWPRTATTRPMAIDGQTADDESQSTPRGSGNSTSAAIGEKESGWHHQQSGVLHSPFLFVR